jgi:rhodanese-related sulfurtransferase
MVMKVNRGLLYEQVARIGKAISSPKRLEILNLLAQSSKTVETLAGEVGIDIKLASAHLRALKEAQLVYGERQGKYILYRLGGDDVAGLLVLLRQVAETHLHELRYVLGEMVDVPELTSVDRRRLLERAEKGEVVVIDVRPEHEYQAGHLPFARSVPLDELETRLNELPRDKEIVAYCRGPFCIMANQAVLALSRHHYNISTIREGINEWRAAGMPLEI